MSRSASALAYDYDLETVNLPRTPRRGYDEAKLLGGRNRGDGWQNAHSPAIEQDWTTRRDRPDRFAEAVELLAFAPGLPNVTQDRHEQSRRVRQPGKLLVTIVGIVVLAAASGPLLAIGRAVTSMPLSLSGYSAMAASTTDAAVQVPVVDATSSKEVALPPPEPAASPSGAYDLTGSPSISVHQIEAILQQYGSPAIGKGQALLDTGVRYGIDPAYALAFFVHESGCGTKGVARFTHSIGNIRWTEGYNSFEGYRSYGSWEEGIEDWYKLISDLYINGWHLRTVDAIVPVYAPYGDNNNPPVYITAVKQMVDAWRGK